MAEKAELIEKFVDMVDGPAEEPVEPQETEQVVEEVLEEELPAGDDHEVEPTVEGDEAEEPLQNVEVTIGDNVYDVPQELADVVAQAQDYTKKTQETAAERKTWETLRASNDILAKQYEFAQSVQEEAGQIAQLDAQIAQYQQYKREQIDSLTPTEFMKIDMAIEELQKGRQTVVEAVTTKQSEHQQALEQSQKELRDKSTEVLRSKVPNWGDEIEKQTLDFGQSMGFTEDELKAGAVVDPRAMEILWMASQYKALKDKTAPAVAKVKTAPAIQPKARKSMPKETQDQLNLRKQIKSEKLSTRQKRQLIQDDIGKRWA